MAVVPRAAFPRVNPRCETFEESRWWMVDIRSSMLHSGIHCARIRAAIVRVPMSYNNVARASLYPSFLLGPLPSLRLALVPSAL